MNILDDVAYIPLTQGKKAIVDARDYEWLMQWKWHYKTSCKGGYAARIDLTTGKRVNVSMHRLIFALHAPSIDIEGLDIDHRNQDKLDNRFENFRPSTRHQNSGNRGANQANQCGFKGVKAHNDVWCAQISEHGKRINLGYYATAEEAALAYNEAAVRVFGEFAHLNSVTGATTFTRLNGSKNSIGYSFKGVSFVKRSGKWAAYAKKDGKRVHLGYFLTEGEAAQRVQQYRSSIDESVTKSA